LISDLSSRFIDLAGRGGQRDPDTLDRVCDLLGVDYAVLWQWSADDPVSSRPPRPPCPGRPAPSEPLRQEHYPWYRRQMLAGRVVAISTLEELPVDAAVDRESCLLAHQVESVSPLAWGRAARRRPGPQHPAGEREWSDALVKRLQLVAQVFANALARRRADQALRDSEEVGRATFEQAAVGLAHVGTDGRWLRSTTSSAPSSLPARGAAAADLPGPHHPDDLETDLQLVRQVLSGALTTYSMEKRYFRKDGSWCGST